MASVADILDDMDRASGTYEAPKKAEPFSPETLPDVPPLPAPGIYFGMPFEQYLSLPALGAHGIQDMAASPMIYWARHSWLSETARKQTTKPVAPQTAMTRLIGEAYHCRILEGAEAYAARYCCELEPCDDALESTDQIKAAIAAAGEKPSAKVPDNLPDGTAYMRAAKKDDWIAQLLEIDPQAKIQAELERRYREEHAGKQFIPADAFEQIELAARMISLDESAKHAVSGGYPEVTLIWYCAETGVPMKARVDYLKLRAMVDLKSYANDHRSPEEAVRRAVTGFRYAFQPSVYWEGAKAVKALLKPDGGGVIEIRDEFMTKEQSLECLKFAHKWAETDGEPEWFWLFQSKGFAPVTRLVRYSGGLSTRLCVDEIIRQAKRKFKAASEAFGTDNWLDIAPAYDMTDDDFPDYSLRI